MRVVCVTTAAAMIVGCNTDREPAGASSTSTASPSPEVTSASAEQPHSAATAATAPSVSLGGLASCQPSQEVSGLSSRWLGLADGDGNGNISRQEAQSFTNFLLGGFFFRADADGSGVVTPEEGRAARMEFINQHPGVATLLSQARAATGQSPFKALASIMDVEYGKPLSAEDARDASRAALDDLFRVVDKDGDGTLTVAEARAASWRGASELTEQEAAVAMGSVVRRLGIPTSRQN